MVNGCCTDFAGVPAWSKPCAMWWPAIGQSLPMMSGCMFLIERSFFESIGLFDERYPLYYEDTDLSVAIVSVRSSEMSGMVCFVATRSRA